ncbi:hypothetical protein TI39_contig426g00004 [Zymoseptoria brevis]|uniref:Uncharacterized protein n=1 Tax=Zymoseptoria brevis TaxID=1047168 RepID=A0A0F4GMC4_9PEZI|nr:hypothetical protein TI39_contig426g00004 [Zymoseptoria brevis]
MFITFNTKSAAVTLRTSATALNQRAYTNVAANINGVIAHDKPHKTESMGVQTYNPLNTIGTRALSKIATDINKVDKRAMSESSKSKFAQVIEAANKANAKAEMEKKSKFAEMIEGANKANTKAVEGGKKTEKASGKGVEKEEGAKEVKKAGWCCACKVCKCGKMG